MEEKITNRPSILQRMGGSAAKISQEVVPSPFVFAIVLSAVVFILGLLLTDSTPYNMLEYWYGGFWNLLSFGMQVVITLLFGYILATSPPFQKGVSRLAKIPKNAGQVIMMVAFLAIIFGIVNWAVGLIVGAIAAKQLCEHASLRGIKVHYPLAAAAGFSALLLNVVFSASAPLLSNTEGHFLQEKIGLIPVSETILAPYSIIMVITFLIVIPLVCRAMMPKDEDIVEVRLSHGTNDSDHDLSPDKIKETPLSKNKKTFADILENSKMLTAIPALAGTIYVVIFFINRGFDLNLDIVNFILLILGLIAYRTPIAYAHAIDDGIKSCGQVVLQFPFYAGIMGMMAASGLVTVASQWMVSIATPDTFPLIALVSAGIVNLFVPSAGGQWAVQGPILVEAASQLKVDMGLTIMAFTYGDQLTNGLQPMWMLPLLGIVDLKAKDILGYTAVMMMFAFVIFALGLTVLPHFFS